MKKLLSSAAVVMSLIAVSEESVAVPVIDPRYTATLVTQGHNGEWSFDVEYDASSNTISFIVVQSPANQHMWDGWRWTVADVKKNGDVVKFDGNSNIPTTRDGKPVKKPNGNPADEDDKLKFNNTEFDVKTFDLKISSVEPTDGRTLYPIENISKIPEPSSLFLISTGIFGFLCRRRINNSPVTPLEPGV